jgi:hypothetical protein
MPKLFNRIIEFHIEGEIYDNDTKPESILNNYNWSFEDNVDGNIQLFAHHKDKRGRITKITKSGKIKPWKKPDTERFIPL